MLALVLGTWEEHPESFILTESYNSNINDNKITKASKDLFLTQALN